MAISDKRDETSFPEIYFEDRNNYYVKIKDKKSDIIQLMINKSGTTEARTNPPPMGEGGGLLSTIPVSCPGFHRYANI